MTWDEVMAYLTANGNAIGKAGERGDTNAVRIMALYQMVYSCPGDPGARGLLTAAVTEYRDASATVAQ
jgi:hypothetical protein